MLKFKEKILQLLNKIFCTEILGREYEVLGTLEYKKNNI